MVNSLFPNVSPTLLAGILSLVTGGVLLILVGLGLGHPILVRMGWRNMRRRPGQTLVLLCGLLLSTMVITASFGLSDSFTNSAVQHRLAQMGNVDESVTGTFTRTQLQSALSRIRGNSNVQAATAIGFYPQSPTVTSQRTGFSVHDVDVYAVPPDFEAVYGPITDAQGRQTHFADLRPNEVFISPALAQSLAARPGDTLSISFDSTVTTVRAILSNDIGVTSGEAIASATAQIIMPLARAQQLDPQPADTICIKNVGPGGMDDTGPGGSRSRAVVNLLQQVFPGASASLNVPHAFGQTEFDVTRIHPLKPDVVERTSNLLQINKLVFLTPVGQQFSWLPPLFTCLLVGAGMLLLVLLVVLLAAERRAELGMSRAVGLQRGHLVQALLFEGAGYAGAGALIGLLLGIGATALELAAFSLLPKLGVGEAGNAVPISVIGVGSLHLWLSWQSALSACCISFLTTMATVLVAALWISRMNIVTAIRDLDEPASEHPSLPGLWRTLWSPPLDAANGPIPETLARRLSRRSGAILGLTWGLWRRGPLCLLTGGVLYALANTQALDWLRQIAIVVLIAGAGLLLAWIGELGMDRGRGGLAPARGVTAFRGLARRLGYSFIGAGWLAYGVLSGNVFLSLFQPVVSFTGAPPAPEILLSMLLLVVGAVVLVMTNADLLAVLMTGILRRVRGLLPVSRTSLVYPLTFRFRTGVTVTLLSLVTFLVLLLVTTNLGAIQEAQAATNSGGFQLEATVFGSQLYRYSALPAQLSAIQTRRLLRADFSAVGLLRLMYDFPNKGLPVPLRLNLPGQSAYRLNSPPMVADDAFLSSTTMPMYARARGFSSDSQVWDAVRDHPGDVVLQYDPQIAGLPTSNDFAPFSVEMPDSSASTAHYHRVTVIGLVAASTPWRVLLSIRTARSIIQPPYIQFINTYLFRLQPGVSEEQAAQNLNRTLAASSRGITVQSLDQGSLNSITAVFTLFLGSYLALGLCFGVLALAVIASRAVVERRQQIGMLRALGFSRPLVRRSFLLESSFVIALSLLVGTTLALWLAFQVARATYQNFPLPIWPLTLILLGSFLITFICTTLPAQRAARLHPAEALRYE